MSLSSSMTLACLSNSKKHGSVLESVIVAILITDSIR